jgi:transposase-like protein
VKVQSFKDLLETLKHLKYSNPKPKICPKCKSGKIYAKESYGLLPQTYKCKECFYEGYLVLELEKDEHG